jgi:hypothetical protein
MADDEAEHSNATAGSGFSPGSLHEMPAKTPVSGPEHQSQREPEAAAPESQPEFETTAPEPEEAEPSATVSPATRSQGEAQTRVDTQAPDTGAAGPSSFELEPGFAHSPAPAGAQTKPRSRFPGLAATALAGGILGFGGTLVLRHFEAPEAPRENTVAGGEQIASLNARVDASDAKSETSASESRAAIAALEARVAAAESAANKAADLVNAAGADLQKDIAARPPGQEPAAGSNATGVPDIGPLNARIGSIEEKLTSLEAALAAPKAELRAHPQDRENPAATRGSRAQAVAIVAQGLLLKLESGGPISDELAALENLGVPADSLAPLRAVAASADMSERQLTAQFAALAPAIIASDPANQASPDENFVDRVTRHAKSLVHVRRVGAAGDTDVEGLVARIENALADRDLEAAYKVWNELPSVAMTKSASWGEAAKARLDAINAARSIEAGAVAVLGKPKP